MASLIEREIPGLLNPAARPEGAAHQSQRIEGKIDAVLSLLSGAENLSDRRWRELDRSPDSASQGREAKTRFAALAAELTDALDRRNLVASERRPASTGLPTSAAADIDRQAEFDRLWDRLLGLADDLATTPASSLLEIRIKALALRELSEEKSDDIVHRLASSLASDLFALKDGR